MSSVAGGPRPPRPPRQGGPRQNGILRGGLGEGGPRQTGPKEGGLGRGEGGPRQNGILRGGLGKWGQRGGLGSPEAVCNTDPGIHPPKYIIGTNTVYSYIEG